MKDFEIEKEMRVQSLAEQMGESGGFTAKELATGVKILKEVREDTQCLKLLSFPANIIATGTRGVIRDLVKKDLFDVIITTSGMLDHDISMCQPDDLKPNALAGLQNLRELLDAGFDSFQEYREFKKMK